MYYPLSAFLLVFSNLIHNPEDPSAVSDLQLMDVVVSTLSPMMSRIGPYNATAALKLFEKLRNVAKEFVENRLHQHSKKTKRTLDSDVPKDDRQPVAVVPDPGISVPNARAREGPSNMVCV
jgi:hypothetical protein